MKQWKCEKCGAEIFEIEHDYDLHALRVTDKDGKIICKVYPADMNAMIEDHEVLDKGGCPICDGWDDGNGNACVEHLCKTHEEIEKEVEAYMQRLGEFIEEMDLSLYDPEKDYGVIRYVGDINDVRNAFYSDIEEGFEIEEDFDEFLIRHRIPFDDYRF